MHTSEMTLSEAVARTIKALLGERRVDVKVFAGSVAHTSQSTVYRQLAGETKINSDQLEYLADALGISTADLITRAIELRARLDSTEGRVREVTAQKIEDDEPTS